VPFLAKNQAFSYFSLPRRKTRKRVLHVLVFVLFSSYFFLNAVPVEAAACPTGLDITISVDCSWDVGTHTYTGTLTINSGVTVTAGNASIPGLVVVTAEDMDVQGDIDADTLGEANASGTGAGVSSSEGSGAGYGGVGGVNPAQNSGITYGSITQPDDIGSGGGNDTTEFKNGGKGGGAVKIVASGTLTVDGTISVIGGAPVGDDAGAGSGGSVWLDAGTIAGSGTVTADGGNAISAHGGGGGGGGRIAIYYDSGTTSSLAVTAYGGDRGTQFGTTGSGGAGTIFIDDTDDSNPNGELIIDNDEDTYGNYTDIKEDITVDILNISSNAKPNVTSGYTLTVSSTITPSGTNRPTVATASGGTFAPPSGTTSFSGFDLENNGSIDNVTTLTYTTGTFDNNGTFADGLTSLTVGSSATFIQTTTTALFSGSDLIVESGGTFTQAHTSTIDVGTVWIKSGGTLTHSDNSSTKAAVLDISSTTIIIDSGATVTAEELGFDRGYGDGKGGDTTNYASGGGYGGYGGDASQLGGEGYGSLNQPNDLGSPGGNDTNSGLNDGRPGGGAIKLVATGTMTLNGVIVADGGGLTSGDDGAGSGGSVWVNVGTLAGTGTITANGGSTTQYGGGGGGGRVAVYYTGGDPDNYVLSAEGGSSNLVGNSSHGGAGTIYLKQSSANAELIVDGSDSTSMNVTETGDATTLTFDSIVVREGADYRVKTGNDWTLASGGTISGSGTVDPVVRFDSGATFDTTDASFSFSGFDIYMAGEHAGSTSFSISNGTYFLDRTTATLSGGTPSFTIGSSGTLDIGGATTFTVGTITIQSGGTLTHNANSTTKAHVIDISATTINVQSGGLIDADGLGLIADTGTGAGQPSSGYGSGAGYGGAGGAGSFAGGTTYGSASSPNDLGSGGGDDTGSGVADGSSGGGLIKLNVSGTMTINGTVSADGADVPGSIGDDGAGSGGSVWVTVGTLEGSTCVITADGGSAASDGGGGGGGRIAVYYTTDNSNCSSGATATGGTGPGVGADGADGTVNLYSNSPTIDSLTSDPSSPTTDDVVTISSQASFDGNIKKIELWLDGTIGVDDPVRICNYSPVGSPKTCSFIAGQLSAGTHTMAVRATGNDDTTSTDTGTVSVAGQTTDNQILLSRLAVSVTDVDFTLIFTPTGTDTGTLTVTFPAEFTVTQAGQAGSSSGCLSNFSYTSTTLVATKTSCSGATTLSGAKVTNPSSPGAYTITWTNDNGSGQVYIVDSDQVTVSSDVDPSLSFNSTSEHRPHATGHTPAMAAL
jgi:hypothetical protein